MYRAFFHKSLCSKNPILGIFSLKMGHFLFREVGNPVACLVFRARKRDTHSPGFIPAERPEFFFPDIARKVSRLAKKGNLRKTAAGLSEED